MVCKIDTCSVIFVHSTISKERRSEKIILTRSWILVVVDSDKDNADKCEYKYLHVIFSISIREKKSARIEKFNDFKMCFSEIYFKAQCSVFRYEDQGVFLFCTLHAVRCASNSYLKALQY